MSLRPRHGLGRSTLDVVESLQMVFVGLKAGRVAWNRCRWRRQRHLQCAGDCRGDLVLDREHIGELPIVPFRPEVAAIDCGDELGHDPNAIASLSDAAFEHGRHAEGHRDLAHVFMPAFEGERRRACDHLQVRDLGQEIDDLLGKAVTEVIVLLVAAHVLEREHGDRRPRVA